MEALRVFVIGLCMFVVLSLGCLMLNIMATEYIRDNQTLWIFVYIPVGLVLHIASVPAIIYITLLEAMIGSTGDVRYVEREVSNVWGLTWPLIGVCFLTWISPVLRGVGPMVMTGVAVASRFDLKAALQNKKVVAETERLDKTKEYDEELSNLERLKAELNELKNQK